MLVLTDVRAQSTYIRTQQSSNTNMYNTSCKLLPLALRLPNVTVCKTPFLRAVHIEPLLYNNLVLSEPEDEARVGFRISRNIEQFLPQQQYDRFTGPILRFGLVVRGL